MRAGRERDLSRRDAAAALTGAGARRDGENCVHQPLMTPYPEFPCSPRRANTPFANCPNVRINKSSTPMAVPHKRRAIYRRRFRPANPASSQPGLCEMMSKYSDSPLFDTRAIASEVWLWDARRGKYRQS